MADKSSLLETGKHVTRRSAGLVTRTAGNAFFFRVEVNISSNSFELASPFFLLLSRCDFRDTNTYKWSLLAVLALSSAVVVNAVDSPVLFSRETSGCDTS